MYSPTFWEHVRHPRNSRSLPGALVGEAQYKRCGDKLKIFLEVDDVRIIKASFQAKACAPVVAVASLATERLIDLDTEAALKLDIFAIDKELGGLPPSKRHAFLLLLECLSKALETTKKSNSFKEKKNDRSQSIFDTDIPVGP